MHFFTLLSADTQPFPTQFILLGAIMLVFYFFIIRPQQKKARDQKKFLAELKKGDRIITIGGIHGEVYATHEQTVVVDIDQQGTRVTFNKSAITLAPNAAQKK
jgi:preprotein translocase subunit YajC